MEVLVMISQIPAVQLAIIAVLILGLKLATKRYKWAKTLAGLAVNAYVYAEKEGIVQGIKGYAKFDPFMDRFVKEFNETFGRDPNPSEKATAVKQMENLVIGETKTPVALVGESSGV